MNVSREAIEVVRRVHDLVETIRSRGVELRQVGRSFMGRCPFHDDHTPSLTVDPAKQLWNCLGACGANGAKSGGDVIAFVMKKDGMTFLEALRRLGYVEPPMPGKRSESQASPEATEKETDTLSVDRRGLLRRVVEHYHRTFRERREGQDYLGRRGLTSPDMLAAFEVGYSDGSLVRMLDEDTASSLKAIGVLTAKGSELFRGCVVFPLTLPDLGVVGLYGRQVDRQQHLYLPGPHRGVFHWQAMKGSPEVIVTESVIDALSLFQAGFQNVTAVYGANGLTADHLALLARFRVSSLLLCLDNDDAGSKATEKIAARVKELGIESVDARLPGAKDPNALLTLLGAEAMIPKVRKALEDAKVSLAPASPPRSGHPQVSREEGKGAGWIIAFPERSYRVRGLSGNGLDQLRINLHLGNSGGMHVETLDLYSQRARSGWIRAAAHEVRAKEEDLTREVNVIIAVLEGLRLDLLKAGDSSSGKIEIPDQEREAALRSLRAPNLIDLVLDDFEHGGFVGERTALSVGYLAAISRLLEEPLGVFIVSRSGAGKSSLQDAVCDFVPDEYLAKYTRVTGQALFYGDSESLVNKVLAVDEERGAAEASYSLRVLQSAQELSIVTTETDPDTGKHRANTHTVKGPVAIFLTTAAPEALDFETRNRFIQVGIDESEEQTRRILARQRDMETLDGIVRRAEAQAIRLRQHNLQRLLRPLQVVNPYAPLLRYPDQSLLMRREQKKYLSLIKAIALLHQHQREVKRVKRGDVELEYVEVVPGDITLANRLAREVLGHSLDELAPPTRDLLKQLVKLAHGNGHGFTRKDVKDATRWSDWSVREHLGQLVKMEYVVLTGGGNGQRMTYELLFDGDPDEEKRYLAGLVDVEELLARQRGSASEPCGENSQLAGRIGSS